MQEHETLDWVNREGRERAAPSIANPSWLVLARRRELFRHWIQQLPASNLSVLDLGGRIVRRHDASGLGTGRHILRMDQGERLHPGVYWVRLTHDDRSLTAKGMVLR